MRTLAVLLAALAGAVAGVLGSFAHQGTALGLPTGLALAGALSASTFALAGLLLGRPAVAAAALGWVAAVLVLATRRVEGDLVVDGSASGYAWLLGGTLLAGSAVAVRWSRGARGFRRRRPRPMTQAWQVRRVREP